MATSVFLRQRVERLARLIDESRGTRRGRSHARTPVDHELARAVAITSALSDIGFRDQAEPEFRVGLRAMLMATAERDGIGATAVQPEIARRLPAARHRRFARYTSDLGARAPRGDDRAWHLPVRDRRARAAIVLGLVGGAIGVAGMLPASGNSVPGDPLYGVKRSTERAQLALAGSDSSRGQLYLEFARTRMNEASAQHDDPTGLAALLVDMDDETRQGVRLLTGSAWSRHETGPLDLIDAFVANQRVALAAAARRSSGAEVAVYQSSSLLDAIAERTVGLRATLACDGPTDAGTAVGQQFDPLGPVPTPCLARLTTGDASFGDAGGEATTSLPR